MSKPQSPNKTMTLKHALTKIEAVILTALLALIAIIILNFQAITDWFKLLGYHPPSEVVQLASDDTFTRYTRHLFYLNRPQLLNSVSSFRTACPENPSTVVLGCYYGGQRGIYIYNVSDPSLAGISQVTAAHEVLHAVYARLSSSERTKLNTELQNFYQTGLQDPTVKAEVKLYQQTEPNSVYDEMSCTFGTELADLPPGLNNYYAHYFSNRSSIIKFEQNYLAAFSSRQATISQDDAQLATLKSQINANLTQLSNQHQALDAERAQLNPTDDSAIASYNGAVSSYNALANSTQSLIAQYNQLITERNQVAGQIASLDKAIDTRIPALSGK